MGCAPLTGIRYWTTGGHRAPARNAVQEEPQGLLWPSTFAAAVVKIFNRWILKRPCGENTPRTVASSGQLSDRGVTKPGRIYTKKSPISQQSYGGLLFAVGEFGSDHTALIKTTVDGSESDLVQILPSLATVLVQMPPGLVNSRGILDSGQTKRQRHASGSE